MAENETIAAIATAAGPGGIGIVRISGNQAATIAQKLFRPARSRQERKRPAVSDFKAYQLNYGFIVDPRDGQKLDESLLTFMPAPHSYTREDVVEIQCHGGSVVLQKILGLVLMCGPRLAEPGEFTRRAYLNGRIDLTQAEAVADMINARSETAMKLAARQLGGGLRHKIATLIHQVTDMLANIEAELEFGEDGVAGVSGAGVTSASIRELVISPMRALLESYKFGRVLREGLRLAIVGRPNVGKSSLLNRLIDCEKAIVAPFPGTTRDPVEATASINGVAVDIVDTAGLRESLDPVERIGIQKAQEALKEADVALFVIDAQELRSPEEQCIFLELKETEFVLVVNKIDLVEEGRKINLPPEYCDCRHVYISAKTGEGLDDLKRCIAQLWARERDAEPNEALICDLRHKIALESALEDAQNAAHEIDENCAMDMVSMDLKSTLVQLQLIIGEGTETKILDTIFKKFCIGK
ncbi:MAG: tRNA uridine-5-carboxymethylaminomethyl(34) synthesis GTPase MnmE [Desulfobacterales bacterium]|nr:tRNA uridine-5-carboxymethylaminomethyl(34) synthesis GTPase MnmE [Desulfobacterales bacterium]